jgi:energy-converting hydrogenase A subunit R
MDFEGFDEMVAYEGKQFISDLDGPVTRNDNAQELCQRFIPRGRELYSVLSKYDEALAYVTRRQGFKQGDSLRLILPFLKAYGVTDMAMQEHSRQNISLVTGADKAMRFVQELMASFIVSGSYEHYVGVVCESIGFPFDNAYCTRVSLDSVRIDDWEAQILRNMAQEIAAMPFTGVPVNARTIWDLTPRDQGIVSRLDDLFWHEMNDLNSFRLVMDVNPLGADEKAASIVDISKKTGVGLEDTMYIGDNLSDVQALALVKRGGGLPVAFNANESAVREAEVLVLSQNAVTTSILAEAFHRAGRDGAMSLVENWTLEHISSSGLVHDYLVRELQRVFPQQLPKVVKVTHDNVEPLIQESMRFRRSVRGEAVG